VALPALLLMTVTDNFSFRATESPGKGSFGHVEGSEGVLAHLVPDNCHR
jgi:hypothetical protein